MVEADPLPALLGEIVGLLTDGQEPRWAARISRVASALAAARTPPERHDVLRSILGMYGGMGSLSDLVLQDMGGALPEQRRFDQARSELFECARAELS